MAAEHSVTALLSLAVLLVASSAGQAQQEYPVLKELEIEEIPKPAEEPESWRQFFEERTLLGVEASETINDNVFLNDNDKQEDFISMLEGRVLFTDPRGAFLYGLLYEANGQRYHRFDENSLQHDFKIFADLETGGRTDFEFTYELEQAYALVLGPDRIDVLRRNTGFQGIAEHTWDAKVRYALNETNALVPKVQYHLYDDQAIDDGNSDRRQFYGILDLDHDLRPGWVLYGGYEFEDTRIPANSLKDSESNKIRAGLRRELDPRTSMDLLLRFEHRRWSTDQQRNNLSFVGTWTHSIGPRTELSLTHQDERVPSFSPTRLQFRSTQSSINLNYELSPLTTLSIGGSYEKQRSTQEDAVLGTTVGTRIGRLYGLRAGLIWQFREKISFKLNYNFGRSKTSDYTNHVWTFGIETEF